MSTNCYCDLTVQFFSSCYVLWVLNVIGCEANQGRIEPPKAARGHATHIDGIVLNVTKFRSQILCSLHCVIGRSARTIEVLSAYTKCVHVEDRYEYFYGKGGLTRSTRTSTFSNIQHYAVYVSTIGSCMPSRRLRRLDAPLVRSSKHASEKFSLTHILLWLSNPHNPNN